MLIIPYSAELSLARPPVVTYIVIALCLVIFYMQANNRSDIFQALQPFCNQLYDESLGQDDIDFLSTQKSACFGFIYNMHSQPDKSIVEHWIKKENDESHVYSDEELDEVIQIAKQNYNDFRLEAPPSLDAKLMYNPTSWNPIRTISSALSHASWWHVIGNLIFFFAFAAAIETLLVSKLHYIGFMLMVALTTDITYSLSIALSSSPPIPSLGLSGVVFGVIGLSAFLMPRVRIRTFIWVIVFFVRAFPMPAWILAFWFIGWDAYNLMAYSDHGGVNLIAHVSGGVAGYLYGFFFLKNRREDIQDELNDEIDYMKGTRNKQFATTNSYKGGDKYLQNVREQDAKREYANYNQKLYRLVNSGNSSEAIVLFLKDYDHYKDSIEVYEELFQEMEKWQKCRALLCLGRLIISLFLEKNNNKDALKITKRCLDIQEDFVLSDPAEALKLAEYAIDLQQHSLAYRIIRKARLRYGEYIDQTYCQLLEARLLLLHLDNRDEAKIVLKGLVEKEPTTWRKEIAALIQIYKHG